MRKLWGIFCIAVICIVFGKMAGWHDEQPVPADEEQVLPADGGQDGTADAGRQNFAAGGEQKRVALTFDDGPHPVYTERLLDGLKARNITASFFVIGENAEQCPELIKRMEEEGHLIGNHTWHHVQLNKLSAEKACEEVMAVNQELEAITGEVPLYLRPPFGAWDRKEDCPAEMISVYWDVDPLDWKTMDAGLVAQRVLEEAEDGDIILLHDIYETSVEAAFLIVDELVRRGYEFVSVEELFFN